MGVWHDLDDNGGTGSIHGDHGARWQLVGHGVLNVVSDLVEDDGARVGRGRSIAQVQFARHFPVSETTWRILDEHVFRHHPEAILRYGWLRDGYGDVRLTFLDHLPSVRRLSLEGRHVDLTPARRHGGIVHLGVSDGAVSLRPMTQVASVRSLWLGKGARHREIVGDLPNLEELTISGWSADDLSHLEHLEHLRSLAFWFGTRRSFADLPKLQHLTRVDIWRTRQLEIADLAPLNDIDGLQTLALRELPKVSTLTWLANHSLRNLELDLENLGSLTSVSGVPHLENLAIRHPVPRDLLAQLTRLLSVRAVYLYPPALNQVHDGEPPSDAPFALRPIDVVDGQFMHHPPSATP